MEYEYPKCTTKDGTFMKLRSIRSARIWQRHGYDIYFCDGHHKPDDVGYPFPEVISTPEDEGKAFNEKVDAFLKCHDCEWVHYYVKVD